MLIDSNKLKEWINNEKNLISEFSELWINANEVLQKIKQLEQEQGK